MRETWTLALAIVFTTLPLLPRLQGRRDHVFFMLRDEPGSALFLVSAASLWFQYRLQTGLRDWTLTFRDPHQTDAEQTCSSKTGRRRIEWCRGW
jgi:hypothetical protein